MRIRYILPVVAAAGVALFALTPAGAQPAYPPTSPALTVSAATVVVGSSVVATGTGFGAEEPVEVTVSIAPFAASQFTPEGTGGEATVLQLAARTVSAQAEQTVQADANGAFSTPVQLWKVGRATITATGTESGVSASAVVTVVASGKGLPATGSNSGALLWVGAAAVSGGGLLLLLGTLLRRQRQRRTDP